MCERQYCAKKQSSGLRERYIERLGVICCPHCSGLYKSTRLTVLFKIPKYALSRNIETSRLQILKL